MMPAQAPPTTQLRGYLLAIVSRMTSGVCLPPPKTSRIDGHAGVARRSCSQQLSVTDRVEAPCALTTTTPLSFQPCWKGLLCRPSDFSASSSILWTRFTEKTSPLRTIYDASALPCDKTAFYHTRLNFPLSVAYRFCVAVVIRSETGALLPPSRPKVHGMLAPVCGEKLLEITFSRVGRSISPTIMAGSRLRNVSFQVNDPGALPNHAERALHLFHSRKVRVGIA